MELLPQHATPDEPQMSITPEMILDDAAQMQKQAEEDDECKGIFIVRQANKWIDQAKTKPIPKMLFGEFWFESELCILFADTNVGKSILAVQIANSITNGEPVSGFTFEAKPQPVLYFDFELSEKHFQRRYSVNYEKEYLFSPLLWRSEMNPEKADYDHKKFTDFEDYLYDSFEKAIVHSGAKVLIIDNITYMKNQTEKSEFALPLMKRLQALKRKFGLSILALAHTPKRDMSKIITRNDLQGSKMLINFCDSSFTIGESQNDKNLRYLKQIKTRSTEEIYHTRHVCMCQLVKPFNFLGFEFMGYSTEKEHLRIQTDKELDDLDKKVTELNHQGKSLVTSQYP